MRKLHEPTCKHLLRRPLVLGIPLPGLLALLLLVVCIEVVVPGSVLGTVAGVMLGGVGYIVLRCLVRWARPGWGEGILFRIERCFGSAQQIVASPCASSLTFTPSETLDAEGLFLAQEDLRTRLNELEPGMTLRFDIESGARGASCSEVTVTPGCVRKISRDAQAILGIVPKQAHVYSLYCLPVLTDPTWLSAQVERIQGEVRVLISIRALDPFQIKSRIEGSRQRSASHGRVSNVDSEITFEDASQVLRGLSRGDERLFEMSVVIVSSEALRLDPACFCLERDRKLPLYSVLGFRGRPHRSHIVREVTATDLVPLFLDPVAPRDAIVRSRRARPVQFNPLDSRLEALHWLVVGASGSGKSFFTGLVLKRLIASGSQISVLFIDHNRSFRRFVRASGGPYGELASLVALEREARQSLLALDQVGGIAGVELSDLPLSEKKQAAHSLLLSIEDFLRSRATLHPVYVVLDECWNFLRDEPVLVQRAFREFRKLNGGAIAITHGLSDFLRDETGSSVFQNAPIRILLRQGEDISPYKGLLCLNDVELQQVRFLSQKKGQYSECLIKTPFLSTIARLYPTQADHELLRSDTIREELIAEQKSLRAGSGGGR